MNLKSYIKKIIRGCELYEKDFVFFLGIFLVFCSTTNVFGYVYVPIDGVEISSINSIEVPSSDIFGDYKVVKEKVETSTVI